MVKSFKEYIKEDASNGSSVRHKEHTHVVNHHVVGKVFKSYFKDVNAAKRFHNHIQSKGGTSGIKELGIEEAAVDIHNLGLGDKVFHAKHGVGKVVKTTEKPGVHVQFTSGTKKFHKGNAHELSEYYGHSMYEED